jgi:D-glycero-alpha-D-manno-heptose-7-phosphate kinase
VIISRTPFRVSFFGGGTDYPDWFRDNGGGAVLSTTIDKYCYISVRELPPFFDHRFRVVYSIVENVRTIEEIRHPAARAVLAYLGVKRGLEVHHDGDLPARSGIGSSSAFTVGLISAIHALEGRHRSKEGLANEAIHVEQCILREPVGVQDQISTAFGGFNQIVFTADGAYQVHPVILPAARLDALQHHLLLVFTGVARAPTGTTHAHIDDFKSQVSELRAMRQMVDQAVAIVTSPGASLDEFGRLLHEAWTIKRTLSAHISNRAVDDVYEAARRAGAIGGKLLGAGGGGFMLLFVRPEDRARVIAAVGGRATVPVRFESSGSRIVLYQPDGLESLHG